MSQRDVLYGAWGEPNKSESRLTLGILRPFVVSQKRPLNETLKAQNCTLVL